MASRADTAPERGLGCSNLRLVRRGPDGAERVVLLDVSAQFEANAISLITGAIGSGKTTLLHILCAILRPTAGEVYADGQPISRFATVHRDRWRREAGLALQASHFLDDLTVVENVMAPLIPRAVSLGRARDQALRELERFAILALADRSAAGLSGGERQRATLARALVGQPRFVFADEPTAHQDQVGTELIMQRLIESRDRGATVVVVSHDSRLRQAEIADRVWELRDGVLEVVGS
jgi:putative ABC transport system ATP-binding protein